MVAVLASSLSLILVGCSESSDKTSSDSEPLKAGELTEALPAAAGDIDVLNWAVPPGEPTGLDPRGASTKSQKLVLAQLCDSLIRINPDYSYEPNLVDYKQVDPLTLELTLVADAKFWNGAPVTVDDIVYSMRRTMEPEAGFSYYYQNVASVEKSDDKTVTVKFKRPDELFIKEIGGPAGMVVEKAFTEAARDKFGTPGNQIMCSGPLKLKSWDVGRSITLERNDDYWNEEFRSHAKTIKLSFITDSTTLAQALDSGEVDGAYEVPTAVIPSLEDSDAGKVYFGDGPLVYNMGWAHGDPPLDDVKLRKALYISLDREALADKIFHGAGQAAYTLNWRGTWDSDAISQWEAAEQPYREINAYDLDAATKLVEESGYDGQELVMTTRSGDETMSLVAQYIQQQAKTIGVSIKINAVQSVDYSTQFYDAEARKGTDILMGPSYNGHRDPMEHIGYYYEKDGPYNWTKHDDPKVRDLIDQARQTLDTEERVDLLIQAQELYEPHYTIVSLVSLYEVSFLSSKLGGLVATTAYDRMPSLALIGANE